MRSRAHVILIGLVVSSTAVAQQPPAARPLGSGYGGKIRKHAKDVVKDPPKDVTAPPAKLKIAPAAPPAPKVVTAWAQRTHDKAIQARAAAASAEEIAARAEAEADKATRWEAETNQHAGLAGNRVALAKSRLQTARRQMATALRQMAQLGRQVTAAEIELEHHRRGTVATFFLGESPAYYDTRIRLEDLNRKLVAVARRYHVLEEEVLSETLALNEAATTREQVQVAAAERSATAARSRQTASAARQGALSAGKQASHLEGVAKRVGERLDRISTLVDQYRLYLDGPQKAVYHRGAKRFGLRSFIEPKPGEASQDAVAAAPERGVFAIADGVSESDFAGEFARALVRRFAERPPEGADDFGRWLKGVQKEWASQTEALVAPARTRAWYEPAAPDETVAHAAFVGARFVAERPGQGRVDLLGNGDSVAILVRKGKIVKSFPLTEFSQFLNKVKALPSRGDSPHALLTASWKVKPGDEVFLTTDALGAWLLGLPDGGREGFERLRAIDSQKQMRRFVKSARAGESGAKLVIDDTAFVRFVVPAATEAP